MRAVYLSLLLAGGALPAHSQVVLGGSPTSVTIEGYGNATFGLADARAPDGSRDAEGRFDGAVRVLGRIETMQGPDIGARIVIEQSPGSGLQIGEASVLLFGSSGRLEIGDRVGLPDVLTGYAPNNFSFTGAEFGPASGPSLDPAGGLHLAFLEPSVAAQIAPLTVLGFASSLSDDRSGKILYVTPKARGFLGGISYAPQADDPRYEDLVQLGLTHERYWAQNVLRLGGSYTFARGQRSDAGQGAFDDLQSINLGVTATLDDSLMLGVSATFNGDSGIGFQAPGARVSPSSAWGVTASANYNRGPWSCGAYYQLARAEGDLEARGDDRLSAFEAGVSYRFHTRMRLYGAWYAYEFADEGGIGGADGSGNLLLVGLRLTL